MTRNDEQGLSPHRYDVDLAPLRGVTVLDEPLDLLYGGVLRLRFSDPHDGLMRVDATLTNEEAGALERAMARVEPEVPGDRRTKAQRDCDRFVSVVKLVADAAAPHRTAPT